MIYKKCSKCSAKKPRTKKYFPILGITQCGTNRWSSRCRVCVRIYFRKYSSTDRWRALERKKRRIFRIKRAVWIDGLKSLPCKDCGGVFSPWIMDFHHRDPKTKIGTISMLAPRSISKDRVLKEMEKCDLVCANCHRDREYKSKRSAYK